MKTAFLLARLEEETFMNQSEGSEDGTVVKCHLVQSLYGLRQAPRTFKGTFYEEMMKPGPVKSVADNCFVFKNENSELTLVCHYDDDGIIISGISSPS